MKDKKQPTSTNFIIFLVILAFAIIGFSFYALKVLDPGPKPGPVKSLMHFGSNNIGGKFTLTDTENKTFTEENLKGKISLIYFGFTFCPDICPTSLQTISVALEKLSSNELENVQVIFVTIDPNRDNITQLKSYLSNFHPNIIGLTGSEDQITKIADSYKVYYSKVEPDSDSDLYQMDHSSIIYMMNKNGNYIKHFSSKATSDEIFTELKKELSL